MLREGRGEVDLGLLVLGPVVRHLALVAQLLERLPEARDVAVPEDAPHAGDEAVLLAVALDVLLRQEADDGLPDRQPHRCSTDRSSRLAGPRTPSLSAAPPFAPTRCNRLQV